MNKFPKFNIRNLINSFYLNRDYPEINKILNEVQGFQFKSIDEIQYIQLIKLKKILKHAAQTTPYYKELFKAIDFYPDDLTDISKLSKLPLLTKNIIRENKKKIVSDSYNIDDLIKKRTGGSTSTPLQLYWDQSAATYKYATVLRHNSWVGFVPGNKYAALWGDTAKKISFKEKIRRHFYERVIYLDTLKIDDSYLEKFIRKIKRFKPEILFGHAHSIFMLTEFMDDNKIENPGIKGIITTAEMLYDYERRKIEDIFGQIVFNRYGCEEVSLIASECEVHDGLHINADNVLIEIVESDEESPGKIVITDLVNFSMPFIRYDIGDAAQIKNGICPCGRGLPRIENLYGRTSEYLYTTDRKKVSGISILDTFAIHIPGIKQIQFIQEDYDKLIINIVRTKGFGVESIDKLNEKIPLFFGEGMHFNLNFIEKIPQTRRGKYQFSICKIKRD
jgi:phenylacetate-CoA ligase